jgi:hypothetical protein
MHSEELLQNISWLNIFKLRASYGQLGNENIGLYRYQSLINATTGVETVFGNPDITWETVNMFNAGFDLSIFNNYADITFDVYDKLTKDIILNPPVAVIGGTSSTDINAGEVRNRGFELSINLGENIRDFTYNVNVGVSYNENEIEKLFGGPYDQNVSIEKEGYPLNSYYRYKTDGLLQIDDFEGQIDNEWIPKEGIVILDGQAPGDIHYVDTDRDGLITPEDRMIEGKPYPNWNFFSNINFEYKRLSLEVLFQGVADVYGYYTTMHTNPISMVEQHRTPLSAQKDYWTEDNPDAKYPRLLPDPAVNNYASDFWKFNADYLRVKYIQLSYSLNRNLINRIGMSNLLIYINAQNPFTFSSQNLVDPESRGSARTYPLVKTNSIGVQINF